LAIQLLSHTVSAAIKTCIATGELKSSTAYNTANFIDIVNNMFDSANSKHIYDLNPNKRPMCDRNPQVLENLENANSMFQNARKICHRTKKISTPPCFIGILWTTTAIHQMYESENLEIMNDDPKQEYFLMTNRLTQDALENLFSIMRQKNGYEFLLCHNQYLIFISFKINKISFFMLLISYFFVNINIFLGIIEIQQLYRLFRCCFGNICSFSLMRCNSSCSNCETDDGEFLM